MAKIRSHASVNRIKVGLNFGAETIPVGLLAGRNYQIFFEYDDNFVSLGLNISPFKLPLEKGLQTFNSTLFDGLPGIFDDSLPDGWGRLLLDRLLRTRNLLPEEVSVLYRLAHVGLAGLGALVYEPDLSESESSELLHLEALAKQTQDVLAGNADDVLTELIALNGSAAGARPKALIGLDEAKKHIVSGQHNLLDNYEHWIVKFANQNDGLDAGAIEYVYSLMAREAGIDMPETHLFTATKGAGYFAVKRFDRNTNTRLHTHTASGLLHSDFRVPALDYEDLLALTEALTKDIREVEKMFRLAVFNVLSHI
jgi:serine/threonine-protein kinase HipA